MFLKAGQMLHFGEFVLDPAARSLSRNGSRVALSRRSFDVLYYMAQHPGEVLSREQLLQHVWPDTHVDENSLSQSISALRRALDEKPGENTYIATVPGRGYQFALPVETIGEPRTTASVDSTAAGAQLLVEERTVSHRVVSSERLTRTGRTRVLLAAGTIVALAAAFGYRLWRQNEDNPPGHTTAVIADLDNETGDPEFDHTLNKVLQIDLQQSPFFTVVSEGRARRTLKMMRQDPTELMTGPLAREVCQRVNGQVYLVPAIAKLGSRYSLTMQLNNCSDGRELASSRKEAGSKNDVLAGWANLTLRMRRAAGESRRSVKDFDKPLYDEPTSSLDALRAYSEAVRQGDAGKYKESIALYQHAAELDPNFAIAWLDMSSMYFNISDEVHDKQAITHAYALRDYANERERFAIELRYAQSVTGDLNALLDALHNWAATYPEDNLPLDDLVNMETWTGHYPEAASYADRVAAIEDRMNIHNGIAYEIEARAYHHANLPDKLRATYAKALQWKVDTQGMHGVMLQFAAENGDSAEVDRQLAWSRNTPNETHLLQEAGMAALAAGQVKRAEALFAEARQTAARDKMQDSLVDLDDYYVRMLVELGLKDHARAVLKLLPTSDPSLDRAFAQAALGDFDPALAAAEHMHAASPHDTLVNAEYVPSVQAVIALQKGDSKQAVHLLEPCAPFELRDPTVPYLRGESFLAANQPAQAITEFSKLAGRPWIDDPAAPLTTLAYLGLARAYAQQHNGAIAAQQYGRFLDAWSHADQDLPVIKQARQELAELQHQTTSPTSAM